MATQHYNLPTINGADPISSVNAINGLANAVDSALYVVDAEATQIGTKADSAAQTASEASTAANAATTNATAALQAAQGASSTAATAASNANEAIAQVAALASKFVLSEVSTSSNVSHTGDPAVSLTLAKNTDGSIYKFYGNVYNEGTTAATLTKVAIPGGSGNYAYGVATGLMVAAPASAYIVRPAGFRNHYHTSASTATDAGISGFAVGTDGQVYIEPASGNTAVSLPNTGRTIIGYIPFICFNANFGDN